MIYRRAAACFILMIFQTMVCSSEITQKNDSVLLSTKKAQDSKKIEPDDKKQTEAKKSDEIIFPKHVNEQKTIDADEIGKNFMELERQIDESLRREFPEFSLLKNIPSFGLIPNEYFEKKNNVNNVIKSQDLGAATNFKKKETPNKQEDEIDPTIKLLKALGAPLDDKKAEPTTNLEDIKMLFNNLDQMMGKPQLVSLDSPFGDDLGDVAIIELEDSDEKKIPVIETIEITIPINMEEENGENNNLGQAIADAMINMENNNVNVILRGFDFEKTKKMDHNIKIFYHDNLINIPQDANIDRSHQNIVNITWKSNNEGDLNNYLYIKYKIQYERGYLEIQHAVLKLVKDHKKSIEYVLDEPFHMEGYDGKNNILLNLEESVGIDFLNPKPLDVMIIENGEKFSTHWLAFSIALLGLLVAGFIMILSYVIHSKNSYIRRSNSISKIPIA